MKKTKVFTKIFLFLAEFLLLLFTLNRVVYAETSCTCYDFPEGSWCVICECNEWGWCQDCHVDSSCGGGGCFTGDTKIAMGDRDSDLRFEKEIKDIKRGDVVKSFNAQTGEIRESTVSGIHKTTAPGYWVLKTESGREVEVTGEHPILAVKAKKSQAPNNKSQTPLRQGFVRGAANSKLQILNNNFKTLFSSLTELVGRIF